MHPNVVIFRSAFSCALVGKAREASVSLTEVISQGFAEDQFLPPGLFTTDQTVAIALCLAEVENEKWRDKRVTRPRTSWHPRRVRARRPA